MSEASPKSALVEALENELAAASPMLVDNADLLRGILSGCGDCIKILDLDGRLQFMSEGGKRVMEVEDFSALKGCPWPSFWEGQGNIDAVAALKSAAAGRTAHFQGAANTAKGTPRYWDVQVSPVFGGDGKPSHLLSISRDITVEWRAAERQRFLGEELEHRVKNMLANVISIANQTFKGEQHQAARTAFNARLLTLKRAHDLLTDSHWGQTSIRRIVESALESHIFEDGAVRIDGPEFAFGPRQALALALATNELATNAMKYGALSVPGGRIEISWATDLPGERPVFQWLWRESGGPAVAAPARTGFGSRLIRTLLADELKGVADIAYEPEGVVCSIRTPLENLRGEEARGAAPVIPSQRA